MTESVATYKLCGVPIAVADEDRATDLIIQAAGDRRPYEVHLCNTYTLSLVDADSKLRNALMEADLNLSDGTPVAWLGARRGQRSPVRGPGLVHAIFRKGQSAGLRHYLFGGAVGVAEAMAYSLLNKYPDAVIVGLEEPPYRELTDQEVTALAERLQALDANVLWIGTGTPRQDYLVRRLGDKVSGAIIPVGAAFDFVSGRVKEAPKRLHNSGLEWAYRLLREPRRLWRRYLVGFPLFVVSVLRHRVGR